MTYTDTHVSFSLLSLLSRTMSHVSHLFGVCINWCWPGFFIFSIPRKTLVSVSPVEKMFEFWQDGIFTVVPCVSPRSFPP